MPRQSTPDGVERVGLGPGRPAARAAARAVACRGVRPMPKLQGAGPPGAPHCVPHHLGGYPARLEPTAPAARGGAATGGWRRGAGA